MTRLGFFIHFVHYFVFLSFLSFFFLFFWWVLLCLGRRFEGRTAAIFKKKIIFFFFHFHLAFGWFSKLFFFCSVLLVSDGV